MLIPKLKETKLVTLRDTSLARQLQKSGPCLKIVCQREKEERIYLPDPSRSSITLPSLPDGKEVNSPTLLGCSTWPLWNLQGSQVPRPVACCLKCP